MKYRINISGCDDETIWEEELSEQEAELLMRIASRSGQVSTYGCMPTLIIKQRPADSAKESL